jgi:hypothetical protein
MHLDFFLKVILKDIDGGVSFDVLDDIRTNGVRPGVRTRVRYPSSRVLSVALFTDTIDSTILSLSFYDRSLDPLAPGFDG